MPAFRSHDLVGSSAQLLFIPGAANYRFPPFMANAAPRKIVLSTGSKGLMLCESSLEGICGHAHKDQHHAGFTH